MAIKVRDELSGDEFDAEVLQQLDAERSGPMGEHSVAILRATGRYGIGGYWAQRLIEREWQWRPVVVLG